MKFAKGEDFSVKSILTFLSLVLIFSTSSAMTDAAKISAVSGASITSKHLPSVSETATESGKPVGLLAVSVLAIAPHSVPVPPRYQTPEFSRVPAAKIITQPLIGWNNIKCYGGTGALGARG